MARQSLLLILNHPTLNSKTLIPAAFNSSQPQTVTIQSNDPVESLTESIKLVQSLPPDTQLLLNFISNSISIEVQCPVSDGLMALLLSIETFIHDFQFNWISNECESETVSTWSEAFPFINFFKPKITDGLFSIPNSFTIPQIGQVHLNTNYFLNHLTPSGSAIKVVRKERIKGFLSDESVIPISSCPMIPAKFQVNLEADGILFEVKCQGSSALMFLDISEKSLNFIEAVYYKFAKNLLDPAVDPTINNIKANSSAVLNNKWLDRSFSLSDWTNEDSIDEDSMKKNNKLKLKKLILLSLRGMSIKKGDKQFMDVWKHLYCGCLFSLRKELSTMDIDQKVLIKTIKENIKFLNL